MGDFVVGDIVVVAFPFSDLKKQKMRPALVVAKAEFSNLILCQITSKPYSSKIAIPIENNNFASGSLPVASYVRPDKIFTADPSIIKGKSGSLNELTTKRILVEIRQLFTL